MKRLLISSLVMFVALLFSVLPKVWGQTSTNTINYKITYDGTNQVYTVWVTPNYVVPNTNNTTSTEKGATAQVSIVVPKDFVISNITDVKGSWEKTPLKLGPGQSSQNWNGYGLDPTLNYYIIGKIVGEADYGSFQIGQDVALFTFKGNNCYGPVKILSSTDPFVNAADQLYSLSVNCSFYSHSGTPSGGVGNQKPLEQFSGVSGAAAVCGAITMVANPDNTTTNKGTASIVNVLANDTNNGVAVNANNVTVSIVNQPLNGTAVVNADGTITYTPNSSFIGNDCYTYKVCDKAVITNCGTAQNCVTVKATAPVLVINPETPSTNVGTPVTTPVLNNDTSNGSPINAGNVTVTIATPPTNGTAVVNADGTITYTPTPGFTGSDCYTYKVCDKTFATTCGTAQNCVTVKANLPAKIIYAYNDANIIFTGQTAAGNVLINDDLATGTAPLKATIIPISYPANGSVVLNSNGSYTYTPNAGFVGSDSFKYQVCDSSSPVVCATATVFIEVGEQNSTTNNAPIALGDVAATKSGIPVSGNVLSNDTDPDAGQTLTVLFVNNPARGTLMLNADGTYTYTPNTSFVGTDSFVYQVCDNGTPQKCSSATVMINVYDVNTSNLPPIANADLVKRTGTLPVSGNVLANDKDPEGGILILNTTPIVAPTNGTVKLNADGSFTYTPNVGYVGNDRFTYEVCDNFNPKACSQAVVYVITRSSASNNNTDLKITKRLEGAKIRVINETLTYILTVKNLGPNTATNIVVRDSASTGLTIVSGTPNKGTFTKPLWVIPSLAVGDSAVLSISAKVITEGVSFNFAQIISLDQTDNYLVNNDDNACVSVPIPLCPGQIFTPNVPTQFTNVVWFKDGVRVGTGNSYDITSVGSYTFTATNATCPSYGCCPIVVVDGNCCPATVCIPFVIKRTK